MDIGGTSAKVGIFDKCDPDGTPRLLAGTQIVFHEDKEKHPMVQTMYDEVFPWLDEHYFPRKISGVSIAATGQIDVDTGLVMGTCGNLPNWIGTELGAYSREFFNCPVVAGNDANMMLLGEVTYGAGRGVDNVLGITLGTGVGGGILSNGTLVEGAKGYAGEVGHISLFGPEGRLCTCGQHGCVEQYCATSALLRMARESGLDAPDAKTFCDDKDDPENPERERYEAVWYKWLDNLGHAITGFVHLFNPELVLIGGGISAQGENLLAPIRERVQALAMPEFSRELRIEKAALENNAGLYGALANFKRRYPDLCNQ